MLNLLRFQRIQMSLSGILLASVILAVSSAHASQAGLQCRKGNLGACANPGWVVADSAFGDLNQDGIHDAAILMDSLDTTSESIQSDIERFILILIGNRNGVFRVQERFGCPCTACLGISGSAGIEGIEKGRLILGIARGGNCRYQTRLELIWKDPKWRIARRYSKSHCSHPEETPCPAKEETRDSLASDALPEERECFREILSDEDFVRRRHLVNREMHLWTNEPNSLLQRTRTQTTLPDSLPLFDGLEDE